MCVLSCLVHVISVLLCGGELVFMRLKFKIKCDFFIHVNETVLCLKAEKKKLIFMAKQIDN